VSQFAATNWVACGTLRMPNKLGVTVRVLLEFFGGHLVVFGVATLGLLVGVNSRNSPPQRSLGTSQLAKNRDNAH
jgi:hypothetical protein